MDDNDKNARRVALLRLWVDTRYGGNRNEAGRALGYKDGAFLRQMLDGHRAVTEKTVSKVHSLRGCDGWFDQPVGAELMQDIPGIRLVPKAHPMGLPQAILEPPILTWEGILAGEQLPERFVVLMPDGALTGDTEAGEELVFETGRAPKAGRPVVIEDFSGRRYIRNYAEGKGGSWRALATTPAFVSFDSSEDDIKVLAALRWKA